MLPTPQRRGRNLAGVVAGCLAALRGEDDPLALPPVRAAVVIVVDGLGHTQLRASAAYARTLNRAEGATRPIRTVLPTTTSAALTALATGQLPGEHGLVGYRILDPDRDALVTTLNDWSSDVPAGRWMRSRTLWEDAAAEGVATAAIGPSAHAGSGFTAAVLRGAEYVPAAGLADRFASLARILRDGRHRLIYLYVSELDMIGHERGWETERWSGTLEQLDGEVARAAHSLPADVGMLLTADHGMVDVPSDRQVVIDDHPALVRGVRHVGGEPRFLHLYTGDPAHADDLAEGWRERFGDRAWVRTRVEAIEEGWFGPVAGPVTGRIGDVLVAARGRLAFYTADANPRSRAMVGQHGSLSDDEVLVPLLRFGAFASSG